MSGKQRIQLTLDCDIVDAAKDKYLSVSNRVNELLAMYMPRMFTWRPSL